MNRISKQLTKIVLVLVLVSAAALGLAQKAPAKVIGAKKADAVALKKFPGKIVGKTKIENEEGKWQYGVLVMSGKTLREVMVDAKTGRIASVEITNMKKEGKEAIEDAKRAKSSTHKAGKKKAADDGDKGEKEDSDGH